MLNLLGVFAVLASLTIIVLGIPAQIVKNYRRRSCEGIDRKLIYSVSVTYLAWALYAWFKPDWFLFASQVPGFLLCLVMMYQFWLYRN